MAFPLQQVNRSGGARAPIVPLSFGSGWNVLLGRADAQILNNNATPILDPDLFINVAAGATYAFHIYGFFEANGAQDVRFSLGGTATLTRLVAGNRRTDNANTINVTTPTLYTPSPFTAFPASIVANTSLGEFNGPIEIFGAVTPATGGTFGFAWCQGTAASPVNPTTRLRGSWMEWKLVT